MTTISDLTIVLTAEYALISLFVDGTLTFYRVRGHWIRK